MNIKNKIFQITATQALISLVAGFLSGGLSACFKVDLPPGTELVTCQIVKPDGTNANGPIKVSIFENKNFWEKLIEPNSNGIISLPAISSKSSQQQGYFCSISSKDGYWGTRDSNLLQEDARIRLEPGGWINVHWVGSGLPLDNFSFENYLFPEISIGLNSTYNNLLQLPSGPFIINALPSSRSHDGTVIRYTKYGFLEAGKTVMLKLGTKIKNYEIKCLLPENLPNDLKLTLSLQVNPNQDLKIKPYFCLIEKAHQQEIQRMAKEEVELFYFDNWPINANGIFQFIANETWAKVTITARRGNHVLPLKAVEFNMGEVRTKTVNLQNSETFLKFIE